MNKKSLLLAMILLNSYSMTSFSIETTRNSDGLTALHLAAGFGNTKEVEKLIDHGADVFALDSKMGVSILHKAVYSGKAETVNYLLEKGALINLQSPSNGNTPLHDAIYFKNGDDLSVIRSLLAHNPNVFIRNRAGLTPLESAKALNDKPVVELIESYWGKKITSKGKELMAAVHNNNSQKVKELLKDPIAIEESDEQGFTPLLWAARQGYVDICELLLEKGANPNHLDEWMQANAGHKAAFWGRSDVMKLLIKYKLAIDSQGGYNGYTALHDATQRSHLDVVKILLEAGAKRNIKGHDGKTALDIANASHNKDLIKLFSK